MNLAGKHVDLVRRLGKLADERARSGIHGSTHATDPETIKALAGLGYIGDDVVDHVREELAEKSTVDLIAGIGKEPDCLLRLQGVRALEGRKLTGEERTALESIAAKDGSTAVREGIRALLAR